MWIGRAKRFYGVGTKNLADWITPSEKRKWDQLLLCAAEIARALHAHGTKTTWTQFRLMVLTCCREVGMPDPQPAIPDVFESLTK
jgi:hypothetical protein